MKILKAKKIEFEEFTVEYRDPDTECMCISRCTCICKCRRYPDGTWTGVGVHFGFDTDARYITHGEKDELEKTYQKFKERSQNAN